MNTNLIINGEQISGLGESISVLNPANERPVADVNSATESQIIEAIQSAKVAFQTYKNFSDDQIITAFSNIAADLESEKAEIARLITLEQGKPLSLACFEVDAAIYWINSTAALQIPIEVIDTQQGKTIEVYNRPLGIVASITPWNWPFMIAVWHIFPALKAKNCVVNKPSQYTPLSTIKLVEIINRHLPKGVCNIVLGKGRVIGDILSKHPDIAKVTFTGSTRIGQQILANSVDTLKSVVLELGGNDIGIVLNDIDIDLTAEKIFGAAFVNAGQTCAALKRLYVHEDIYEPLVKKLVEIANAQVVGDGLNVNTTFGPVQNKDQYLFVKKLIDQALASGGSILTDHKSFSSGYFIAPTIMTGVNEQSEVVFDEQFGPVLPVMKFKDVNDVITIANSLDFGLGGSVWSKNTELAKEIASKMECGTVWINSHADLFPNAEFGGWKQSGLGHSFGLSGLLQYTHKQSIHTTN